jgi:hypothetical protein
VLRVPLADGTLVPTPGVPSNDLLPSLLTTSDVLGTGWFAADAANVKPGSTVAVVGDDKPLIERSSMKMASILRTASKAVRSWSTCDCAPSIRCRRGAE